MGLATKEECKESEMGKKLLPVLQHGFWKKLTDGLQLQHVWEFGLCGSACVSTYTFCHRQIGTGSWFTASVC